MTAQDIKLQDNHICEKCGSKMYERKLSIKDNGAISWKRILQCTTCRHWKPI